MFTLSDVKDLFHPQAHQDTLSLYLHVDNALQENQATNPAWRIGLKKYLRHLDDQLAHHTDANWPTIRERADEFFRGYTPASKSLVAFFGPDWEQIQPLPVPVENNAAYGKPLVGPLLRALNDYKPYLVVVVDREEAHFYESYLGQTAFRDSIELDLEAYDFGQKTGKPSAASFPGGHSGVQLSNRDVYEDMIHEHRMRFYRDVADHTHQLADRGHITRIILGGDEQSAHTVRKQLPESLQKSVVALVSIPRHYRLHEIFEQVQPIALAHERDEETRQVEAVINAARAGGRAVLGAEAVKTALDRQQVAAVLLAWPPEDQDLANDLAYQVLLLNGDFTIVHDEAAEALRAAGGGAAAQLYYTL